MDASSSLDTPAVPICDCICGGGGVVPLQVVVCKAARQKQRQAHPQVHAHRHGQAQAHVRSTGRWPLAGKRTPLRPPMPLPFPPDSGNASDENSPPRVASLRDIINQGRAQE